MSAISILGRLTVATAHDCSETKILDDSICDRTHRVLLMRSIIDANLLSKLYEQRTAFTTAVHATGRAQRVVLKTLARRSCSGVERVRIRQGLDLNV
jgi:hypothetical protein